MNILVADDEKGIRNSLSATLRREGHDITLAKNGREVMKMLESARLSGKVIDLLILDLQMPEMTGEEVLCKIKEMENAPPVILMSGHGGNMTAKYRQNHGVVLDKPFEQEELLAAVEISFN